MSGRQLPVHSNSIATYYSDSNTSTSQKPSLNYHTSQNSRLLTSSLLCCMQCRRGLAMRILSVRLSVKRVLCDKMEERLVQIFIPYERSFSLVLWEEKRLVGATPSTWNFWSTGPRWSEIADFQPIFAHSSSAVTPSEKTSVNTNNKSTTRFPMSLRWSSYIIVPKPPKGGLKNAKRLFFV